MMRFTDQISFRDRLPLPGLAVEREIRSEISELS